MTLKSLGLALAAGITAFLVVVVAVTEIAQPWIEFSLFLGIPAGIVAAAFTAAAVYLGLADDAPAGRRRIAGTFGAFGVAYLAALVVLGGIVDIGTALAIVVSAGIALVVAAVAYVRGPSGNGRHSDSGDESKRSSNAN